VQALGEEARVRVRSARRDAIEELKKGEKDGVITEDDLHRLEKEVQTMTDKKIARSTSTSCRKRKRS
jgi:ribosome recycling factor